MLLDADMVEGEDRADGEHQAEKASAPAAMPRRCRPRATNAITTPRNMASARSGTIRRAASPPQYCDSSAAPTTATLATRTMMEGAGRGSHAAKDRRRREAAHQKNREYARDQSQTPLDKLRTVRRRNTAAPRPGRTAWRATRGTPAEQEQGITRGAAGDSHDLVRDRRHALEHDDPYAPMIVGGLERGIVGHRA